MAKSGPLTDLIRAVFLCYWTPIPHLALQVPPDSLEEYLGKWDDPPYTGGSGYLARSSPVLHFGLGDAKSVDRLEILSPSGHTQVLTDVAANQRLVVREERGIR